MSDQQAYSEMIKRGNILGVAHKLGMDGNLFTDPGMAEFYSNHEWIVINNNEVGEVINAIPIISMADSIPLGGVVYNGWSNTSSCTFYFKASKKQYDMGGAPW